MLLATSNAQGELSALERGMHALGAPDIRAYAKAVGREKEEQTVRREIRAAEVAKAVDHMVNALSENVRHLAEIHAAPSWLWGALVAAMLGRSAPSAAWARNSRASLRLEIRNGRKMRP
ncbi:MAG TPA: hypothetical protein VND87_12175 [Stellaceae bacterium]|nr:hypothetical protein [Stellaceae bacterium]